MFGQVDRPVGSTRSPLAHVGPRTVLGGRYLVQDRTGVEGTGAAWRAWDRRLQRRVAVERLHGVGHDCDDHGDPGAGARDHARVAAKVMHPGMIAVYDVVDHDDELWLVTEYLPSRSLAAVIAEHGPLDPALVARVGAQVAEALGAVHDAGLVHGDVEPSHVLLAEDGIAKLTHLVGAHAGRRPDAGAGTSGATGCLAPELARGGEPSPASDVFALGATLDAALAGEPMCPRPPGSRTARRARTRGRTRRGADPAILHRQLAPLLHADPARRPGADAVHRTLVQHGAPPTKGIRMDPTQRIPRPRRPDSEEPGPSAPEDCSFEITLRGYDRAQVQATIRELTEAAESDRRRARDAEDRLAEVRAQLAERDEDRDTGDPDTPDGDPVPGSDSPVDELLRVAAGHAAEIRERARSEVESMWERAREAVAAHREQVEDDLRERAEELDRSEASQRVALDRRAQDIADALDARTTEAEGVRRSAEQDAADRLAGVARQAEEILREAERSADRCREEADRDHAEVVAVSEQVGHHLRAVERLVGDLLAGVARTRPEGPTLVAVQQRPRCEDDPVSNHPDPVHPSP